MVEALLWKALTGNREVWVCVSSSTMATEELWMKVRDIIHYKVRDQDHPQEKEIQKGKMVVWGGLANSWEKKRS